MSERLFATAICSIRPLFGSLPDELDTLLDDIEYSITILLAIVPAAAQKLKLILVNDLVGKPARGVHVPRLRAFQEGSTCSSSGPILTNAFCFIRVSFLAKILVFV
jgi:hypothetical protein